MRDICLFLGVYAIAVLVGAGLLWAIGSWIPLGAWGGLVGIIIGVVVVVPAQLYLESQYG